MEFVLRGDNPVRLHSLPGGQLLQLLLGVQYLVRRKPLLAGQLLGLHMHLVDLVKVIDQLLLLPNHPLQLFYPDYLGIFLPFISHPYIRRAYGAIPPTCLSVVPSSTRICFPGLLI